MSRILITGATGFVGKSLVPFLQSAGHEVRCAVWKKADWLDAEQVLINKLELHTDWSETLQNIDIVIHLAARVHIMNDDAQCSLQEYCKVNSIATRTFAEQAAAFGVKRFIFLSSVKVIGEFSSPGAPFNEDSIVHPEDPYAHSKWLAENYLQELSQRSAMEVVILRPPLVYGPQVRANFLKMLQMVKRGWPLPFGAVTNTRSLIYIDNLVSAIHAVMTNPKAANQVYLVADDDAFSLAQLLRALANEMDSSLKLLPFPVSLLQWSFRLIGRNDLNTRLFSSLEVSNKKIKSQLGWTPPVSLSDGLGMTAKWYQHEYSA